MLVFGIFLEINMKEIILLCILFLAHTLHNGGNVLIPCYPSGVLYDLLECIMGFLDMQGFSTVPVYYVSPVAGSSLAHANIYAEW